MISFILSFIKETLSTTKTKLIIRGNDFLASIVKALMVLTGEFTSAIVFSIDINKNMITKAIMVSTAVFFASILASYAFKRTEKDVPHEYLVKFNLVNERDKVYEQLNELEIKVKRKSNKMLIIISMNKYESQCIKDIINNCKWYNVKELKKFKKNN